MRCALLLLVASARAAPEGPLNVHHETYEVLGWNRACSVAVAHYGYPFLGEAIKDEPIWTRLGAHTISPDGAQPGASYQIEAEGPRTWRPEDDAAARQGLKKAGYVLPGFREPLPRRIAPERDLPRLLLSSETYRTPTAIVWPETEWRLHELRFAPIPSQCALLIFRKAEERDYFRLALIRVGNPFARIERARLHATDSRLLLQKGDLDGALNEGATAVALAPESAQLVYNNAGLLNIAGRTDEALAELKRAIALDPAYKGHARTDRDFDNIRWQPEFQKLTAGKVTHHHGIPAPR